MFHMCQWVSMRPGSTIISVASITWAPGALTSRPTAMISPSRTCTTPPAMSPSALSMVITWPLRMTNSPRAGRPAATDCARARRGVAKRLAAPKAAAPRMKLRLQRLHMDLFSPWGSWAFLHPGAAWLAPGSCLFSQAWTDRNGSRHMHPPGPMCGAPTNVRSWEKRTQRGRRPWARVDGDTAMLLPFFIRRTLKAQPNGINFGPMVPQVQFWARRTTIQLARCLLTTCHGSPNFFAHRLIVLPSFFELQHLVSATRPAGRRACGASCLVIASGADRFRLPRRAARCGNATVADAGGFWMIWRR